MLKLDPYLNFNGNTLEVFKFYRSVFGGEFSVLMRYADLPGSDKMPAEDQDKIMHVSLPIGDNNVLMGTDLLSSMNQQAIQGDQYHINISLDNEAEAQRIFEALSKGGVVIMPLNKESWSDLFGMFRDKFGIQWMINYYSPK